MNLRKAATLQAFWLWVGSKGWALISFAIDYDLVTGLMTMNMCSFALNWY